MKLLLFCLAFFGAAMTDFTPEGTSQMLNGHNDFRSTIAMGWLNVDGVQQPAAADMIKLFWNNDLASDAQAYADSCPYRRSGDLADNVGENVYRASRESEIEGNLDDFGLEALGYWKDELNSFGFSSTLFDQAILDDNRITEATQMAWSTTTSVGCGVKNCGLDENTFVPVYEVVVVCRYAERGNQVDQNIYEPGDTCSNCPNFLGCDNGSGLCE